MTKGRATDLEQVLRVPLRCDSAVDISIVWSVECVIGSVSQRRAPAKTYRRADAVVTVTAVAH